MEDKSNVNKGIDIDIDAANIVKESLGGLGGIIPILDRHPKGSLAALILVGIVCSTAISLMQLSRPTEKASSIKEEPSKNSNRSFTVEKVVPLPDYNLQDSEIYHIQTPRSPTKN